jgi:hypothetical protein
LLWLWSVGGALPYRHGGRGKSLHRPLVDRGAGEVADAGKTALGAPLLTGALLPTTMGADVKGSVIAMATNGPGSSQNQYLYQFLNDIDNC